MFFFNLSLVEFLAIFGAVSGLVVTLYLLNRTRRKQIVATLRFWTEAQRPTAVSQRRRIQQPLSLLLQLLSIVLLLLAIAQLRIGSPDNSSRDHVVLLDTSSWMGSRAAAGENGGTLLDQAKASAQSYLRSLPSTDRVMLVFADGLATPATGFTSDRQELERAIQEARPAASALNIDQALAFAKEVQKLHAQRAGETVYIGAGRISPGDIAVRESPGGELRVLKVGRQAENYGLKRIGLRRSASDPGVWEVFVSVRNYGTSSGSVPLVLQFGGATVAARRVSLPPGAREEVTLNFRTRAAGWLEVRLIAKDALAEDNRAILELPQQKPLKVAVYSDQPERLRPVFAATPEVEAVYRKTAEYSPDNDAQVVIFDGFGPPEPPQVSSVWIEPPPDRSPVPVRTEQKNVPILRWRADHPLGAGLRTKALRLRTTQVYAPAEGDIPVAEVDGGPVILARPLPNRTIVLGFHPGRSALRYELATPLLFANVLRWLEPDVFRQSEIFAESAGTVTVPVHADSDPNQIRVLAENGQQLPHTIHGRTIRFFAGTPGTVRVIDNNREQVYSLTLPDVGEETWAAPPFAASGMPPLAQEVMARDLWRILAVLGCLGLLLEWWVYGRRRAEFRNVVNVPSKPLIRKAS